MFQLAYMHVRGPSVCRFKLAGHWSTCPSDALAVVLAALSCCTAKPRGAWSHSLPSSPELSTLWCKPYCACSSLTWGLLQGGVLWRQAGGLLLHRGRLGPELRQPLREAAYHLRRHHSPCSYDREGVPVRTGAHTWPSQVPPNVHAGPDRITNLPSCFAAVCAPCNSPQSDTGVRRLFRWPDRDFA